MDVTSILGGKSTKETIIDILSKDWPITARKLYILLTKQQNISVSYQAVHKSLKELSEQGILSKDKEGYRLSNEWINGLNNFSKRLKDYYHALQNFENKQIYKMKFEKHMDFVKFHIGLLEDIIKKDGKTDMVFYCRHVIYPFILTGDDLKRLMKIMPKIKWAILSRSSTSIDKWYATHWEKLGVKVETGVDIPTNSMLIVNNDCVINVQLYNKSLKKWDELIENRSIENFDGNEMSKILLDSKQKSIITVTKDKEMADMLRYPDNKQKSSKNKI